jgi:catechol 2,3-dioxygenase-like lactoylglutathione lyase family enzyme
MARSDRASPAIETIVETAIYADDLPRTAEFYRTVLGLKVIAEEPGRHVFFEAGDRVLLVFRPQATLQGDLLPAHGAHGPGHVALGVAAGALPTWREWLTRHGVAIEKEMTWPLGGESFYFRDPAGNSVELVIRGIWGSTEGW